MDMPIDLFVILKSLGYTILFVGLIGFERQSRHKVAGLTTHILVALGAASLAIVQEMLYLEAIELIQASDNAALQAASVLERQRIVAQIVTGVGFLGTGAIIKTNGYITGLTTASTLWISAIIGIIFGLGYDVLGISVSVITLLTLIIVKRVFKAFYKDEG